MLDPTRREGSRFYIPALGRLYVGLADVAWLLLRLTVGLTLVPHGMQKAFGAFGGPGMAGVGARSRRWAIRRRPCSPGSSC